MLEQERAYFSEHYDELVANHLGKFVVIKDAKFIKAFSAIDEALADGARRYGLQSFLVRDVTETKIPTLTLGVICNPWGWSYKSQC